MAKGYGTVRYIEDYTNAPENAEYILRELTDGSIVLEQYKSGDSKELKRFSFDAYWETNFYATLTECRQFIACNKIIWVEKPSWMYKYPPMAE